MQLVIYPNPNAGKFYIELNKSKSKTQVIELFNSTGELIYNANLDKNKTKLIDLTGIESGNYLLNIRSDRFEIHRKVIVKKPNDTIENLSEVELEQKSSSSQ